MAHDREQKADVRELVPTPAAGARLLDVGCGTGHWSEFFASMGFIVHGVDISEEMITVARAKAMPGCTFEVADVFRLPYDDNAFDAAAAITSLEFMPAPGRALREMGRCVRPGGFLVVGTLNSDAAINAERVAKGKEPYASAHLMSPEELAALLSPVGDVRLSPNAGLGSTRPLLVAVVGL